MRKKNSTGLIILLIFLPLSILFFFLFILPSTNSDKFKTDYKPIKTPYKAKEEGAEIKNQIGNYKEKCSTEPDFSCLQNEIISTEDFLDSLSSEEKVKQLLGPLYTSKTLKDRSIKKDDFGFYVLISISSYGSAKYIQNDITSNLDTNQKLPPFIGLDAEGGVVKRLSWHKITHLSKLTNISEKEFCEKIKPDVAALKKSGFNWSLAPVVDLPYSTYDWIYPRTISINQNEIINTTNKYIYCMKQERILTTIKHFPGHGDSRIDSHKSIPIIDHKKNKWDKKEGKVFKTILENENADTVLIGHLRYPLISQEISSMSNRWQQEILKEELKFEGLIISDDIFMLNDSINMTCEQISWEALEAGTNVILFVENSDCRGEDIVNHLTKKYDESDENRLLINSRVKKIILFKKEWFQGF